MATKTKTIKMLLYDGALTGVMNISDSAWESGKMYSAPRDSINDLVSRADCKKYGVYLLLSENRVYVGQASDLERRTKQHLSDKDWWSQIILMTTKDDSFNASDIDYLEARLIEIAVEAGKSDNDNKKRGNPQKVDEFRQAELEQYLEEALFLLELIGIRVFKDKSHNPKKNDSYKPKGNPIGDFVVPNGEYYFQRKVKAWGNKILKATMRVVDGKYIVLKGSTVCPVVSKVAAGDRALNMRSRASISSDVLTEDFETNSPSSAAVFVLGGACNGWVEWKTKGGISVDTFRKKQS